MAGCPNQVDLVLIAGEPSGDLHGAKLIEELLRLKPDLKIGAVAGPKMRAFPIDCIEEMEQLKVMGFIDVLLALPKIVRLFFSIRKKIVSLHPKAVVTIDYPGFNLRLQCSLKKQKFAGKQIHYICPTVWAWGKKRIPLMEKTLDQLLAILPFEPACFTHTLLPVQYVGHPLVESIPPQNPAPSRTIALFPGSRPQEVARNLPIQLQTALALQSQDPTLQIVISAANQERADQIRALAPTATLISPSQNYHLMRSAHLALAKSGTVALELALHAVPAVITYAIKPLDLFLATKVFRINLPYYSLPNIILNQPLYPELFGPNLTSQALLHHAARLCFDTEARDACRTACTQLRAHLGTHPSARTAATSILKFLL